MHDKSPSHDHPCGWRPGAATRSAPNGVVNDEPGGAGSSTRTPVTAEVPPLVTTASSRTEPFRVAGLRCTTATDSVAALDGSVVVVAGTVVAGRVVTGTVLAGTVVAGSVVTGRVVRGTVARGSVTGGSLAGCTVDVGAEGGTVDAGAERATVVGGSAAVETGATVAGSVAGTAVAAGSRGTAGAAE